MNNIGTVIGAVVGVFIALLVGLALFGEVSNQTAELGERDIQTYQNNGRYFVDLDECEPNPLITASVSSSGVIESVTLDGVGYCIGSTEDSDEGPVVDFDPSTSRGQGAVIRFSFVTPTPRNTATPTPTAVHTPTPRPPTITPWPPTSTPTTLNTGTGTPTPGPTSTPFPAPFPNTPTPYPPTVTPTNTAAPIATATPDTRKQIRGDTSDITVVNGGEERLASGRDLRGFIALEVILQILPTVVLVGLLAAGGVIGGFIGRSAGGRLQ